MTPQSLGMAVRRLVEAANALEQACDELYAAERRGESVDLARIAVLNHAATAQRAMVLVTTEVIALRGGQ